MIIFFDTETTGLPKKRFNRLNDQSDLPRLVEIAWITCEQNGTILSESEYLIKPDSFTIPQAASSIHGITTEMVQKVGMPCASVLNLFQKDLQNCTLLVGHNVEFDSKIILAEAQRYGIRIPLKYFPSYCTMRSSTRLCKIRRSSGYKYPTLSELHSFLFGSPLIVNHRALEDARSCMRCYMEMKARGLLSKTK